MLIRILHSFLKKASILSWAAVTKEIPYSKKSLMNFYSSFSHKIWHELSNSLTYMAKMCPMHFIFQNQIR